MKSSGPGSAKRDTASLPSMETVITEGPGFIVAVQQDPVVCVRVVCVCVCVCACVRERDRERERESWELMSEVPLELWPLDFAGLPAVGVMVHQLRQKSLSW